MKTLARMIACLLLLAPVAEAAPKTLRAALAGFRFDAAASAPGAPLLDRELTSSAYGRTPDDFVAAYYFKDESGSSLGPLHVSYYDRRASRWAHASELGDAGRSALSVQIGESLIVVDLKQTPSAGSLLVLDKEKLKVITKLPGYFSMVMPEDMVLFGGNMVHFASVHQERLLVFDPKSGRQTEIFPGSPPSTIAAHYRRTVERFYENLPAEQKKRYAEANRSPGGFNLDAGPLAIRKDRTRFVFLATYDCQDLGEAAPAPVQTVVRCDAMGRSWSCKEREIGASQDSEALLLEEMNGGEGR